ncbi:MAG TPA: FHA domain-containing protein [Planctomycetaceae bacterium]|nr:FHA domain-containing protein [Planctomycetaceae bacterium]
MSIVLEAQVAGHPPRRIILRSGQVATFGSDVWTDFSFPADSGMTPRHFQLDCRNERCELIVLDQLADVFQNEMPVRLAQLHSGDRLKIGPTTIRVHFSGLESSWSRDRKSTETPRFTVTTAEACRGVEFAPDVAGIVHSHPVPPECLDALIAAGQVTPAIRVLAAVLPARAAVWWLCDVMKQSLGPESHSDLLKQIEAWVIEPTEGHRRRIEAVVQTADRQSPETWLGWAVFWSGPSLAPASVDPVPPPGHLVGTAVSTAAQLLAGKNPLTMSSTLRQILQHGREVLDGQRPWPTHH